MTVHSEAVQVAHTASVEQNAVEHEESAFGLAAPGWVALSMIVVILFMIWKKVPQAIGRGLDSKIDTIRKQLDEATALRAEAEQLRGKAQATAAATHRDAEAILAHAKVEAEQLVAQAKIDADDLIARRSKMAEDKIAAAERAAIAEVRAKTASVAAAAATALIGKHHDAAADKLLVEKTISRLN
jgi:F-type H+-transporting ATPase subunit b